MVEDAGGSVPRNAWPVVEGWLIDEPYVSAKELMNRLATMVPDVYASKAQLRTDAAPGQDLASRARERNDPEPTEQGGRHSSRSVKQKQNKLRSWRGAGRFAPGEH